MGRHLHSLMSLTCLVGIMSTASAQEAIPAKTLSEIKKATVFVKVAAGNTAASGSGFVMRVEGDTAYVVTNHHVVAAPVDGKPTITLVFRSGTKDEQSVEAEVLASDPEKDLAVLRVKGAKDLTAIDLAKKPEVTETMTVYMLGFPFGSELDKVFKAKGNPAITVGKGTVSSIREDADGKIAGVQIDGNLNPGNSGGPVVDTKGQLVGVAVARVGQGIGLAIPSAHLEQMLLGRVADSSVLAKTVQDGKAEISVEIQLIDPLEKIKVVTVHHVRMDAVKDKLPAAGLAGVAGAEKVELKVDKQKATGKFTIAVKETGLVLFGWQASCDNALGQRVFGAPIPFTVKFGSTVSASDKLVRFEAEKHQGKVECIAFAPNGKMFASGGTDNAILLWDVDKGWVTTTLKGHTEWVRALTFSPDGKQLASSSKTDDQTIRVWDVASGKERRQWKLPNDTTYRPDSVPLAFAPNGRTLAVGGLDNDVTLYDPATGDKQGMLKATRDKEDNYIYPVRCLAYSADGKMLAVAGDDPVIHIWDVAQRKEAARLPKQKGAIRSIAWTSDGKTLAFADTEGALKLWDVANRKERAVLKGHEGTVTALAFTTNGEMLLSGGTDETVRLWQTSSGKELASYKSKNLVCAALAADDLKIATGASDWKVVVLNLDKLLDQKPTKK